MSEEDIYVDHISTECTGTDVVDLEFDDMGIPVAPGRYKLAVAINNEVTHWDNCDPCISWPNHKKMGHVGGLWKAFKGTLKLPENEATKKWFNKTANGHWKDAKTKKLKAVFDRAPNLATAKANCPNMISAQTWEKLCDQFHSISTSDVDGNSKSTKCKDSRKKVLTHHHWGRTSISSWSHNHKAYMGIDALRETGPSISEEGDTEEPYNGIATPEQLRISADLKRVYDETMRGGSDESTANSTAIEKCSEKRNGLELRLQPPQGVQSRDFLQFRRRCR